MNLRGYLKMLRVKEWIKFFTLIPLIGAILADATPSALILVGIIFFCVIGYGFVINNYFDVEIDKRNTKKVFSRFYAGRRQFKYAYTVGCLPVYDNWLRGVTHASNK